MPKSRTCTKKKHIKSGSAKKEANRRTLHYGVPYGSYRCKQCNKYHVGRTDKYKVAKAREVFLEENAAVLGIDPGCTGAICLMYKIPKLSSYYIEIHDFKSTIACFEIIKLLKRKFKVKFAIIEKQTFRPNERNIRTAEILIRNAQTWEDALIFNKIPYEAYYPGQWRAGIIPKTDQNKDGYVKQAIKRFPKYENLFTRHDRCEATLIAYRAWKHIESGMPVLKYTNK